jgi:hypothetical protein
MTVIQSPLRSESGFESPNFLINNDGDLRAVNIIATNNITVEGNFNTTGNISITGDITAVGNFTTNGDFITPNSVISNAIIIKGISVVDSVDTTFKFDDEITRSNLEKLGVLEVLDVVGNVNIKDSTNFDVISITNGIVNVVSKTIGSLNNINIGLTTPAEAAFTEIEVDDIKINNAPTELFHATRKDYVDTTAAALAIALGA